MNINELPLQRIGLKLNLSAQSDFFDSHYTTKDQLTDNLKNLILTPIGSRPLNLEFGTSLSSLLFEPITENTIRDVQESIQQAVRKYIPQVSIRNITISPNSDRNTVRVAFQYRIMPDTRWEIMQMEAR